MPGILVTLLMVWIWWEAAEAKEAPDCEEHEQVELDENTESFYHNN